MPVRKHIDLQRVTQTATELANENGFEAVTLASVAEKLGIRIPSLYNYVSGLAGLRREMTLWGVRELTNQIQRAAIGKAGDDAIFSIAAAYRTFAQAYPGIYAVAMFAPVPDAPEHELAARELLNVIISIMEYYKFGPDDTLHAIRGLRSVLHGFVHLEISGGFGMALDRDESYRQLMQTLIDGLHARQSL